MALVGVGVVAIVVAAGVVVGTADRRTGTQLDLREAVVVQAAPLSPGEISAREEFEAARH